jgi:two-component system, OmpR family, alkaline phosphatase synthesis response regulator PhoP
MIYLLEDDKNIRELVCYSLNVTGNETIGFAAPTEFWQAVSETLPELVILDVMLPEEDGLQVLSKLRGKDATSDIPVIMLTAKGTEFDKVTALDAGADDYITKPFGVMELVSRVKAVLRRSSVSSHGKTYTSGSLCLSVSKHMVTVSGNEIALTYKEFELLKYLFENKGMVLSRDQILQHIWGYDFDGENRTVDVHIRTLRHKLSEAGGLIETIRGVGYRIGDR